LYWLSSGLQRNLGGICNNQPCRHRVLIEDYIEDLLRMLHMLHNVCISCDEEISLEVKLKFFTESRHALAWTRSIEASEDARI